MLINHITKSGGTLFSNSTLIKTVVMLTTVFIDLILYDINIDLYNIVISLNKSSVTKDQEQNEVI